MRPLADRFWEKVDKSGECWIWNASRNVLGYGQFNLYGRPRPAHRISYWMLAGPIAAGLEIDHLCRNPSCVNPSHLEAVTHAENIRRGETAKRNVERGLAMTSCRNGHAVTVSNTGRTKTGWRVCRDCFNEGQRRRRAERKRDEHASLA